MADRALLAGYPWCIWKFWLPQIMMNNIRGYHTSIHCAYGSALMLVLFIWHQMTVMFITTWPPMTTPICIHAMAHVGGNTIMWLLTCGYKLSAWIRMWILYCSYVWQEKQMVDTLRPEQNGWYFAEDIHKYLFVKEMYQIWLKIHWCLW